MLSYSISSHQHAFSGVKTSHHTRRHITRCSVHNKQPEQQPKLASAINSSKFDGTERTFASAIPSVDEDREVAHSAFMHAFQEAQPERARIPGMQEFASAILARARIPSQQYVDPLKHVFEEFDKDGDGVLSSAEVGSALRSRNVEITDDQVQMFIDVVDLSHSHTVKQSEFRDLIMHMAAADLHSRQIEADGEWVRCTLESDDEIQEKLKSWITQVVARRSKL